MARYAIYFAPADHSQLHRLASSWLGRETYTGMAVAQPDVPGIAEKTADPRRYGFHATLKAPFRLGPDVQPEHLMCAVDAMARIFAPIVIPRVELRFIDSFLAIVPTEDNRELQVLASFCVKKLDRYRAPLTPDEVARRRKSGLPARLDELLLMWGYPHVLEHFRFHMTLTGPLDPPKFDIYEHAAAKHFAAILAKPLAVDALCVFREAGPGAPFLLKQRFPLSRADDEAVPESWRLGMR